MYVPQVTVSGLTTASGISSRGISHSQYKLPTSTLQHSNKTDIKQAALCCLSSVKSKELAICLFFSDFKWPVITFSLKESTQVFTVVST